jgi:polysaccharide biosynthesis transport protein
MSTSPHASRPPETLPLETPEFGDYLAAIRRRRGLLFSISLPILAVTAVLAAGLPDIYVATGLVRFTEATISGESPALPVAHSKIFSDLYMAGLKAAVLSPPVLTQLLREIPELVTPGVAREDIMSDIADRTRVKPVMLPILDPGSGRQRSVISAFAITFDSRDPGTAQKGATWLTNAIIGGNRVGLQMRARAARDFYTLSTQSYGRHISALESQLAEFKAQHLLELPELTAINLAMLGRTQQNLDDIAERVRGLEVDRTLLEGRLAQAQLASLDHGLLSQLQGEYNHKLATYDPNHPEMLSLRRQVGSLTLSGESADALSLPAQLQVARRMLVQLRERYSGDYPDVQRLQRQIDALEARMRADGALSVETPLPSNSGNTAVVRLTTQLNALDTQKANLEQRESQLRDKLDTMEQSIAASPLIQREYNTLQKEVTTAHAEYDDLRRNALSLDLTIAAIASGRSDDLIVVQTPFLPQQPEKPRRLAIATIGVALAVFLGFSAVIFRESFDPKVRSRQDVYRMLKAWPLVAIPVLYDRERARRKYWRLGALTACTLAVSVGALITGRMLLN